jgi:putative resolvase
MSKLISLNKASEILGVSKHSLRNWDVEDKLKSIKTIGGHRRYREEDILNYIGEYKKEIIIDAVATYSRVSSYDQKQKGDLDRQSQRLSEYCAKKKYSVHYQIKDTGSGLSDTRSGFVNLIKLVIDKKIFKVVIENKDRLTRFQYNLINAFFNSYGVEIERIENNNISDSDEFVNDMMTLIASFSSKLYGRRSHQNKKKKSEENN